MFFANDLDGNQIQAKPGLLGICPLCGNVVISKCGSIMLWHFAHEFFHDCDQWWEKEGDWHFGWKGIMPPAMREVVVKRTVTRFDFEANRDVEEEWIHRADILNSRGTVIELQHSSINEQVIRERELFYDKMIWLFDLSPQVAGRGQKNLRRREGEEGRKKVVRENFKVVRGPEYFGFEWKHPRMSLLATTRPLYLDFGTKDSIFYVKKFTNNVRPLQGYGHFLSKKDFKALFFV